jgi:hypothetical protein
MARNGRKNLNLSTRRVDRREHLASSLRRWIDIANLLADEEHLPDPWFRPAYAVDARTGSRLTAEPVYLREPFDWDALFRRVFARWGAIERTSYATSPEDQYELAWAVRLTLSRIAQAEREWSVTPEADHIGMTISVPGYPTFRSLQLDHGGRRIFPNPDEFGQFIAILQQVDARNIKLCEVCSAIFLAERKNQLACTDLHRKTLAQRKWRREREGRVHAALNMLSEGKLLKAIAQRLDLSMNAARPYVDEARKLGNKLQKCPGCISHVKRREMRGSRGGDLLCGNCWDREQENAPGAEKLALYKQAFTKTSEEGQQRASTTTAYKQPERNLRTPSKKPRREGRASESL